MRKSLWTLPSGATLWNKLQWLKNRRRLNEYFLQHTKISLACCARIWSSQDVFHEDGKVYKTNTSAWQIYFVSTWFCVSQEEIYFRKVESSPSPNVKRDIKGKCVEWITRDGFGTILFSNNVNHSVGEKIVRNILDAVWYDVSEPYPNVPRDK